MVLLKLGVFSLLMILLPLSTFYAAYHSTLDPVYSSVFGAPPATQSARTTFAGALAVLVANLVTVAYVVSAFREPDMAPRGAKTD